jgi:Kef-type K+ transport system membrane component KefB
MAQAETLTSRPRSWLPAVYVLLLISGAGLFLLIRSHGETLSPPLGSQTPAVRDAEVAARSHVLMHVVAALVVVIVVGRVLGRALAWFGQPPVIGEVLAGICMGPSLLGHVWPGGVELLLPADVAPYLGLVAQLGIILYMFTVGLEFDAAVLHRQAHAAVAISHASILLPFVLGAGLALAIYPTLAPPHVTFTVFSLFLGASMSVTAFPVLARILTDRGMQKTPLGVVALAAAAIDDVTAWCLLAFVVGVAQAKLGSALVVCALTVTYIGLMFLVVRPLAARFVPRSGVLSPGMVAATFLALLCSAWLTEAIGIHAVFGAFLIGAIIPHDSVVARDFSHKLQDLVTVVLLPAFFAFTGMRTQINLIHGWENWLWCGVIVLTATLGKFGGSLAAARLTGQTWRDSAALGVLMNTRGLMELIVLNIGLDLAVISPRLFAMMVVMALVTTLMATPLLRLTPQDLPAKVTPCCRG